LEKREVLKAAVGNIRKELRQHGGKKLFPEGSKEEEAAETPEEELGEKKGGKK
jgi:hypothetical protein